jgi:hypothetical protein
MILNLLSGALRGGFTDYDSTAMCSVQFEQKKLNANFCSASARRERTNIGTRARGGLIDVSFY